MNIFASILVLIFSMTSLAATSSKCPGEEGYYFTNFKLRNPTQGGFVSNKADAQDTDDLIYIGPEVAICGSSHISERARIFGNAVINNATVKGHAEVSESARIEKGAVITGSAKISGSAWISGAVEVSGDATVTEFAKLFNYDSEKLVTVKDKARIAGSAEITENATINGDAKISGQTKLSGDVNVGGKAVIKGFTKRSTGSITSGTLDEPDYEAIAAAKAAADAYKAKCKADAEAAKAAADAAAIQAALKEKQAKEEVQKKLALIRTDIINLGKDANFKASFSNNNCSMNIEQNGKKYDFNFTKASTSSDRSIGNSGVHVEKTSDGDWNLFIESELQNKQWHNFPLFSVNNKDFANNFKEKLQYYWSYCKNQ